MKLSLDLVLASFGKRQSSLWKYMTWTLGNAMRSCEVPMTIFEMSSYLWSIFNIFSNQTNFENTPKLYSLLHICRRFNTIRCKAICIYNAGHIWVLYNFGHRASLEMVVEGLTHWGQVMHICICKLASIVSDNGLSPGQRQAIIWTNTGILFIGPSGTNFS